MSNDQTLAQTPASDKQLVRRVGLFDATMVVIGGIVGSGIFINPYVVAQRVHTPFLMLAAWAAGGILAMLGAFIWAELADRMPQVGGQYAYLRDAYHPVVGFLYGWVLLLVVQTGGMAAVTVTFARYFLELTKLSISDRDVVVITLAIITWINCSGVRLGSRVQSILTVLKILSIAALVFAGLFLIREPHSVIRPLFDQSSPATLIASFASALIPVLFAYGGWQTSNFIAGEIKEPRKNLPRALVVGVAAVITLYVTVSLACVHALGPGALEHSTTPATAVMRLALGERGAILIAAGIAISTLGFLTQSALTAPRVYFAMAEDGLFFRKVASVNARTHVPVVAITMQSVWAVVIALSGRYEQILNYVVSMDFLFFGLTATCIFVFRRRERGEDSHRDSYRVPGHPITTLIFIAVSWLVVLNTLYRYPTNSFLGMGILLLGLPVYAFWRRHPATQ